MSNCKHYDPLKNYSYTGAAERAEELIKRGWVQHRCEKCGLFAIWERGKQAGALFKLLAQEKALRAKRRVVEHQRIKLDKQLARVADQIAKKCGVK